ncbi:acyl-CoA thioesterase [Myroides injenensis]|uniref:acyl-CoA thioesterase n=1 Tax=Myroides injenensis TaxID=1183151 RepID=UPI0002897D5A|nr:thioesterase family protein [Myroides injenensis]
MNFDITNYRFYCPLEIRWNDLDALGHVNNVNYIEYFQIGRGKYMNEVSKTWDWTKHMFVIANISCNYLKEIKLTARNPRIGVRISKLGSKSFDIEYAILSDDEDRKPIVHAIGSSIQVMIDISEKKTIEIPEWLLSEIKNYEPAL